MKKLGYAVDAALYAGRIGGAALNWIKRAPGNVALLGKHIPGMPAAFANNGKRVGQWVRENKLNTLLIAVSVPELAGLVDAVYEEVPEVQSMIESINASDSVATLEMKPDARDKALAKVNETRQEALSRIDALPVSALMNFKDEAQVIEDALSGVSGLFSARTRDEREAQLHALRRLVTMPEENFMLFERLQALRIV